MPSSPQPTRMLLHVFNSAVTAEDWPSAERSAIALLRGPAERALLADAAGLGQAHAHGQELAAVAESVGSVRQDA